MSSRVRNTKQTIYGLFYWSGRRDSNSRSLPWEGSILPLNYARTIKLSVFAKTAPPRKPARIAHATRHRFLVSTSGAKAPSVCLYARRGALNYARIFNYHIFAETAPPRKLIKIRPEVLPGLILLQFVLFCN